MSTKPYSRESLERALIHHGIDYSPPDPARKGRWLVRTGDALTRTEMSSAEVYAYVLGWADARRAQYRRPDLAQARDEARARDGIPGRSA